MEQKSERDGDKLQMLDRPLQWRRNAISGKPGLGQRVVLMAVTTAILIWRQRTFARRRVTLKRATEVANSFADALARFNYDAVLRAMSPWAFSVDETNAYVYGHMLRAYVTRICTSLSGSCAASNGATISHDVRRIDPETFMDVVCVRWCNTNTIIYLIIK